MPVFNNALAGAAGSGGADASYKIERSLRFNSADSASLEKTVPNITTFTFSFWYKYVKDSRSDILVTDSGAGFFFYQHSDGSFRVNSNSGALFTSNGVYRDPSAWYHIVITNDGTTFKLYVNGVLDKSATISTGLTSGGVYIGRDRASANTYGNFYIAEAHFLDGTAISTPENVFGEFDADTGVWNPIEYDGTYGTNGFYLDFSDNSSNGALGDDRSKPDYNKLTGALKTTTGNGSFYSNTSPSRAFDGNTSNEVYGGWVNSGDDSNLIWSPPSGSYSVNSGSNNLRVYAGYYSTIYVNGVSKATGAQSSGSAWVTLNHTGAINSIKVENTVNDNVARISAIEINGTVLVSNAWTVNNLTAKGGVNITSAKIYSSYNGATVSANYSVQYSDDNSNWTTAFSGVMSNNGQCGIQTGTNSGDGSYGAHKYWKLLVGSTVTTHWPRSSRILLSDGTNDYAVRTFTSDNCSDSGGIPQNGDSYTYTSSIGPEDIDSLIDSPTDYEASSGNNGGNYCTMSPIDHHGCTFANGNLKITAGSSKCGRGTFWANSGKWYFEFDITTYGNPYVGIASHGTLQHYVSANSIAINNGGNIYVSTNGSQTYPGKSRRLNAIGNYMCAFDLDNGKIWWGKDGIWYEQASGANSSIALSTVEAGNGATEFSSHPSFGDYWTVQFGTSTSTSAYSLNAGQRPFIYPNSIPSGFKSLCTANLTDPEILDGSAHFTPALYTGTGGTTRIGGQVYSNGTLTGSIDSGNPITRAFDGSTSTGTWAGSSAGFELTFPSAETVASSITVVGGSSQSNYKVIVDGTEHTITFPNGSSSYTQEVTVNVSGSFTGIKATNNYGEIRGIKVDGGPLLVDGQGTSTKFKPDLAWLKSIGTSRYHFWHDSVRGSTKALYSNNSDTEHDYGTSGVTKFHDDGLTVNGAYAANYVNETYVAWLWNGGDLVANSAYNQSEEWSSKLSTYLNSFGSEPVINLFDGDTSTSFYSSSTSGSGIKFVPTTAITGSIELYLRNGDTSNSTFSYSLDNGSTFTNLTTTGGNGSYVSIGNQTISNTNGIIVRHVTTAGTNQVNWRAIKVDNKVLVDPGVISIGSLNSTVYNTSSNWSVAGSNMQNNWSASFDGDTDPHFALPNTGYSASMTFPSAISYQTLELLVARDLYAPDLLVNGNNLNVPKTDTNTTGGRYKIERYYFTNGTLTSIGHETRTTAGRGGSGFWQIIVDGKILVDTNQASNVTNVPSITTKCTTNPTAGFAISTYKGNSTDGATIATKLGSTPEMVIVKARDKSDDWRVYHVGAGNPYYLRLQLGNAGRSGTNNWREMSLNYFALDADSAVNSSSYNYVAYSFSSVPGFSKFGSYTGAGEQKFIPLGFRPAWVMIKRYTDNTVGEWTIYDSARAPSNEIQKKLWANNTSSEEDHPNNSIDFVSNGFVIDPGTDAPNVQYTNNGSVGYLYAAFAENPFKIARAR